VAGVTIIPMRLTVGDRDVRDGDLPIDEVLATPPGKTLTSGPPPAEFVDAIEAAGRDGAIVLTIAADMSGTFEAATLGARLAEARPPARVIDTATAAGAEGLVVLAAARTAAAGGTLDEVEAAARRAIATVRLVAAVEDLERLAKSGRVPAIAGWAGRVLGIYPLFEFRGGKVHRLAPATSRQSAMNALLRRLRHARRPGAALHVSVLQAGDPDGAEDLAKHIREDGEPTSMFVGEFSPVMIAHTGPLLGLAWHVEGG
jgi:DegV family protein with EDD domain